MITKMAKNVKEVLVRVENRQKSENNVRVRNKRGKELMPCSNRKARLLLKDGKAKIYQYDPFTIQLCYATGEYVQK